MRKLETVNITEAAQILGVHRDTVYAAIEEERLRVIDCEGKTRILKADLEAFKKRGPGRPRKQED